jgi:BlaI family penicillinase repressor
MIAGRAEDARLRSFNELKERFQAAYSSRVFSKFDANSFVPGCSRSRSKKVARPGSDYPTQLELEILKILWAESPLLVRDVRQRLEESAKRPLTHSSVITILNIMVRKGYLQRRKEGKAFYFSPKAKKEAISRGLVGDLLGRLFDGSATAMVLNLMETADLDADELNEMRKLINGKSKEKQP